jgi:hypothetical protein
MIGGMTYLRCNIVQVRPVNLEQVDVVRLKALKARVDLGEDGLAGEAGLVHVVTGIAKPRDVRNVDADVVVDLEEALGEDNDSMAGDVVLMKVLE